MEEKALEYQKAREVDFAEFTNKTSVSTGSHLKKERLPVVAVVGRPNVGKSSLVNRLSDSMIDGSITDDKAGITRDRHYHRADWSGYNFKIVDTGGLLFDESQGIYIKEIRQQAAIALSEADVVIFVLEKNVTNVDCEIADFLRKYNNVKKIIAINKLDRKGGDLSNICIEIGKKLHLPTTPIIALSAIHGMGVAELCDEVIKHIPLILHDEVDYSNEDVKIAVVGRPNVGKSSILNLLINETRSIVSDEEGTTRDTIDTLIERNNVTYKLVDTGGIHHLSKMRYKFKDNFEYYVRHRVVQAIIRSDICLLVADVMQGIGAQEQMLAKKIAEEGRACVVLCNKWDLATKPEHNTYEKSVRYVRNLLPMIFWAPIVFISAKTRIRTKNILDLVDAAVKQHRRRTNTALFNQVLTEITAITPPPTKGLKCGKIYYGSQVSISPPTFVVFCNGHKLITDNYRKFLERQLREAYGFEGTPLRWVFKKRLGRVREETRSTTPPTSLVKKTCPPPHA
eukprot:GHVL01012917.1.p1 GENE.GHVL01012917.1~~GHVL01012917.1.p1  ORF type:complete len:584 (-),score=133.27 GHVL01012917.1:73-1605(-)